MTDVTKHSTELAKALDQTAIRATQLKPDEIINAFNKVQSAMLRKASSSAKLALETRRRVAEWKFRLLSERNVPFRTVSRLRTHLHALGYSNLEVEATMEIFFAQYCIRMSRFKKARTVTEELVAKLQRAMKSRNVPVYRHLNDDALRVLADIPA